MNRARQWAFVALICSLHPACATWVKTPEHTVSIVAVDRVKKGEEFTFTVTVKDASGQPLKKVEYEYRIDWVGVEGTTHKGKSGVLEKLRAKGGPGTATLHILGYNAQDVFGEVAKTEFEIVQ